MREILRILRKGLEGLNLFYSSYPGIVVGHSKQNPNHLVVKVPEVSGNNIDYINMAKPKYMIGGPGWGEQFIPRVNDLVWVEFRMGRVDHPIWSPAARNNKEQMEEFPNSRYYGFKTPHGSFYRFDDDNDIFTIQHSYLDRDEKKLVKGAEITIDKDVVKLTHLEHTIELTLDSLKITTTKPLEVNSDANININSAENIIFNNGEKGNMVDINKLVEEVNADRETFSTHMHQVISIGNPTGTPVGTPIVPILVAGLPTVPPTSAGTPITVTPATTTDFDNDKIQQ